MKREKKMAGLKLMLLGWLVLTSCQAPDFLSDIGRAIGNMFRGFGP